jgi:hypothetical protein
MKKQFTWVIAVSLGLVGAGTVRASTVAQPPAAGRAAPAATPQPDLTPADLPASVAALREANPASVAQLPRAQQRVEPGARALIEQLPLVLQESYFITLQDYPTLDPAERKQVNGLLQGLATLPKPKQPGMVTAVTKTYTRVENLPARLAAARRAPHQTLLMLAAPLRRARTAPEPKPVKKTA